MNENFINFKSEILAMKDSEKAKKLMTFFKTKKGQYAYGDVFLGINVPKVRELVKKYYKLLSFDYIEPLLKSEYHEIRLASLLMLVKLFEKASDKDRKLILNIYLNNCSYINNWDLVDLSAPKIVGFYSYLNNSEDILWRLAKSKHLWSERISVVASLYLIKNDKYDYALKVCKFFLNHNHDLMHKAVGWILREVGKRDEKLLVKFIEEYGKYMHRTTLRYSIEKFDEKKRKELLAIKKVNCENI